MRDPNLPQILNGKVSNFSEALARMTSAKIEIEQKLNETNNFEDK